MRNNHHLPALICLLTIGLSCEIANAQPRVWDGGGLFDNWGNGFNWDNNSVPGVSNDVVIDQAVDSFLDQDFSVRGLNLTANGNADTNGHFLDVGNGEIDIALTSSLFVSAHASGPNTAALRTTGIDINNIGTLEMAGGRANIAGLVNINGGGTLNGYGRIHFLNGLGAPTTIFTNNGTLTTGRDLGALATDHFVLQVTAADADARIDLDGSANNRPVSLAENTTFDLDMQSLDFGGTMTMNAGTVFDVANNFRSTSSSILNINASTPNYGVAERATLRGASYTALNGSEINLNSGNLTIDTQFFNANAGSEINATSGTVLEFDGPAAITGDLNTSGVFHLIVNDDVSINDASFNWDGTSTFSSTMVNTGATLTVNSSSIDTDDDYDGSISINGGTLDVTNAGAYEISTAGDVTMDSSTGDALWTGEPIVLRGSFDVAGGNFSRVQAPMTIHTGSSTDVNGSGELISDFVVFKGGSQHTGNGRWSFRRNIQVDGPTTIDMPNGIVDPDRANINLTMTLDSDLTINADDLGGDLGSAGNGTYTINIDNADSTLTVNRTNPAAEWTLGADSTVNITGLGTLNTSLAGSDVNIKGNVNVNDDTRFTARVDLESGSVISVNTNDLHLNGGSAADPNTIAGGFINGNGGRLASSGFRALSGFGTINPDIDFIAGADLQADGGTLVLNGTVVSADVIEVNSGAALQFNNAFNTGDVTVLQMSGGTVQGQPITNDGTIRGHGLIKSIGLASLGTIAAEGGELVIDTTNSPDLDSFGSSTSLEAITGDLTVVDALTDDFSGTATIAAGRQMTFQSGWTQAIASDMFLNGQIGNTATLAGGTTLIRGDIFVDKDARIAAPVTFDSFADVELLHTNDQLRLSDSTIQAGANFTGQGVIVNDGTMVLEDGADVGVVLANAGTLETAGTGVGSVDVEVLDLLGTSVVEFDLAGTGAGNFDVINFGAQALLGGTLRVGLDAFTPSLGDAFPIISSTTGAAIGNFATTALPNLPGNLRWLVNYNGDEVELLVTDMISGDFDGNGDFACNDIDMLVAEIAAMTNDAAFDLTGDGTVDTDDLDAWLAEAGAAELASGNPYLPGDANLDGSVNGQDFVEWNAHKFTNVAEWCSGDFNADGTVNGQDFVIWNNHKFTSADGVAINPVPEPTTGLWLALCIGVSIRRARRM